jgi:hypothetical protein
MFAVLHFCDLIGQFFPEKANESVKDGPEAIQFGVEVLMESRLSFPIADTLQEVLRQIAVDHSIPLPVRLNTTPFLGQLAYSLNKIIDAFTLPSYTQPVCEIQAKFDPTFSANWIAEGPALRSRQVIAASRRLRTLNSEEDRGAQNLMNISNLLNTN